MKSTFIILIFSLSFISTYAQYKGGNEDGFSGSLKPAQNNYSNIYHGGNEDGFSQMVITNQNILPNIYKGGNNDGFVQSLVTSQNPLTDIYVGGQNDGTDLTRASFQNPLSNIFTGGTNDGFATATTANSNPIASIYSGGINDGFSMGQFNSQNSLANIYTGGLDDGFATIKVIGQNPFALPITLLSFQAAWQEKDAKLNWKVADELDVNHYELERSLNAVSFKTITTTKAFNSNGNAKYDYLDIGAAMLGVPVIYYRLKTIHNDGSFEYSGVIRLSLNPTEAVIIVYPNPTKGQFTLRLTNISNSNNYEYALLTSNGSFIVKGKIVNDQTGFDISTKAAGVYILSVLKDGKRIQNFNIILTK